MPFESTVDCPECGNSLWSKLLCEDGKVRCTNCGHERDYTPKRARVDDGYTLSQERRLKQIHDWFEDHTTVDPGEWYKWEEHYSPNGEGRISLVIETDEHPLINETYHLFITRRGKVQAVDGDPATRILRSLYRSKRSVRRCTI